MKQLILLSSIVLAVACGSKDTTTPDNSITVTASVTNVTDVSTGFPVKYWQSKVKLDKAVADSVYVIVQWDAYNGSNVFQATMKDTVGMAANTYGFDFAHRTRYTYSDPWTAQNVRVVGAAAKSGSYTFKY